MVTDAVKEQILAYVRRLAALPRAEIAEQLTEGQQQLVEKIAGLGDSVASARSAPDEWSVRDLTRHMVLAEATVAGFVHALASGDSSLSGLTGHGGDMLDDDTRPFAAWVDDLRRTDVRMLDAVRGLPASPDLAVTAKHPLMGRLNCIEWAAIQRVHDADHLQHVTRLVAAIT